ncbi:MAG: Gfo/Idh/MocA family oxidoreductase [Verrucomicrobia bacterium]|nr:Gfo/Idh/MocA family oxidoreductase [Verrucomicrobiota bacterium]
MKKKMRVIMVGIGGFGGFRRERMRETGLYEIVAAYDFNAEALEACRREDGAAPAASFEALLDTPGVEALVISTGAKFHAEQALRAMERGLHVFVENPLCATPQEVAALLAAHKRTGLVVGVGHNDHTNDAVSLTIKRMIDSGELGAIAVIEKTTAHNGGLLIKPGDWRGDPAKNPGGMLFQCGVHALHELMFYFGPICEVGCMMRYDVHTTQTADAAVCTLRFASGLIGTLNAYHVTPYRHRFDVLGTKANLYREELFFDEGVKLWKQVTHLDGKKEPKVPVAIGEGGDICGNLRSFHRAVREGGTPYPSLIDGARAVAVVFAAEQAAKRGATVALEP